MTTTTQTCCGNDLATRIAKGAVFTVALALIGGIVAGPAGAAVGAKIGAICGGGCAS